MSITEEYKARIEPYRAIFHYQAEVERIARECFLAFNEQERQDFGELLAQVYGENSRIYDVLYLQYDAIKAEKRVLSRSEVHYLVSVILPCLPAVLQYECLQYEVLHTIQKQRLALNHEGFRRVSIDKAFDIYNQYAKSILHLHKAPSQWFHVQGYDESDRQEIIRMMQYVFAQKIKRSIEGFAEDLRTLAHHYRQFAEGVLYFIELLAVEVTLEEGTWSSTQSITNDLELYLPTPAGKFAPFLKAYLVKELEEQNTQRSLQKIQHSMLANDLSTTLMQYKPKGFWRKKAKISFLLEGGAGILKMEKADVRSWFGKFQVREREQIFLGIMGIVYFVPFMIWIVEILSNLFKRDWLAILTLLQLFFPALFGISLFMLGLYVGYFFLYEFISFTTRLFDTPSITIDAEQDQRIASKILINDYDKLVKEKRAEIEKIHETFENLKFTYTAPDAILYEAITTHLHTQAKALLHKYYTGYAQVQFSNYLGLYRKMSEFINDLSIKTLPEHRLIGTSYEEKHQILKASQYILQYRLFKSFRYFLEIGMHTLHQNISINFYSTFLNLDLAVQGEARCFDKCKAQVNKITKHFEEMVRSFEVFVALPALQTWLEKEKAIAQDYNFENEATQIKHQITLQRENKRNKQFTVVPLVLESEEGILYV